MIAFCLPIMLLFVLLSCTPQKGGLFSGKSAHEKYMDRISEAGLDQTELGKKWMQAASSSLSQPIPVSLPYKETGYLPADNPSASSYLFKARRGEIIQVRMTTIPGSGFLLFIELWEQEPGGQPAFIAEGDSSALRFSHESEKEGNYILRVQPELLRGMEYTLTISTTASLAFPVHSSGKPRMISFWGADRDGGARKHEGIDIVAPFRTPVIAAANGRVTRVQEGGLGGKVVFMRPEGKNYSLYYAHLDSQIATEGQAVKTGDILGLLGKTGNAERTTPHLHFGIYAAGGAVDPLPFIDHTRTEPKAITAPLEFVNKEVRTNGAVTIYTMPDPNSQSIKKTIPGQIMRVTGASRNFYKVNLDGTSGYVLGTTVTGAPLMKEKTKTITRLLDHPQVNAAAKTLIPANQEISIMGVHEDFYRVKYKDETGWVKK